MTTSLNSIVRFAFVAAFFSYGDREGDFHFATQRYVYVTANNDATYAFAMKVDFSDCSGNSIETKIGH